MDRLRTTAATSKQALLDAAYNITVSSHALMHILLCFHVHTIYCTTALQTDGHVFTSKAVWRNKMTYYAMLFSTGIAFFVTHTPGVQYILGSNRFPLFVLSIPIGVGFAHLLFESWKRKLLRLLARRRASKNSSSSSNSTAAVTSGYSSSVEMFDRSRALSAAVVSTV
jgi:Cation transporting ATPase, C-terminus